MSAAHSVDDTPARWAVTEHALNRYLDRFAPETYFEDGREQLLALLAVSVQVGVRDTGLPSERGELRGVPSLPAAVFLCRTDPDGTHVCVTVLDAARHQRSFRGQKGHGLYHRARR